MEINQKLIRVLGYFFTNYFRIEKNVSKHFHIRSTILENNVRQGRCEATFKIRCLCIYYLGGGGVEFFESNLLKLRFKKNLM